MWDRGFQGDETMRGEAGERRFQMGETMRWEAGEDRGFQRDETMRWEAGGMGFRGNYRSKTAFNEVFC